jgi:hypothetical protein
MLGARVGKTAYEKHMLIRLAAAFALISVSSNAIEIKVAEKI